jgi:hypothetical protein
VNRTIRTTTIVGVVACTAFAALGAAPAFAASTPTASPTSTASPKAKATHTKKTLAQVQAAAVTTSAKETASLTKSITKVTSNTKVTSADKTTILGTLNADLAGIKTTESKVAGDTTLASATSDYKMIFTDYRVYAVAIPQAAYAVAADTATSTTLPRLTAAEQRLSTRLSGKGAAKSTAALQADLTDMTAQIGKAKTAVSGLSAAALAVTPAQYNANHSVMTSLKATVVTARTALKQARTDAKTIRTALK